MIAPALGRCGLLGLGIQGVRVWGLGGQGFLVLGLEVHGLRFKGLGIFCICCQLFLGWCCASVWVMWGLCGL